MDCLTRIPPQWVTLLFSSLAFTAAFCPAAGTGGVSSRKHLPPGERTSIVLATGCPDEKNLPRLSLIVPDPQLHLPDPQAVLRELSVAMKSKVEMRREAAVEPKAAVKPRDEVKLEPVVRPAPDQRGSGPWRLVTVRPADAFRGRFTGPPVRLRLNAPPKNDIEHPLWEALPTAIKPSNPLSPTESPPTVIKPGNPLSPTESPPTVIKPGNPLSPTESPPTVIKPSNPQSPTEPPPTVIKPGNPLSPTESPPTVIKPSNPQSPTESPPTVIKPGNPQSPTEPPPTAIKPSNPQPPTEPPPTPDRGPPPLRQPAGSLLPPPEKTARRSEQMERIARQADVQIRHGFELAGRGAYFAARAEFIRALRLIAQGLDGEQRSLLHSRCLAAGLTAIKEAEDFLPLGSGLEADLDLADIVGRHRTPVLKNSRTGNLTTMLALKCYLTFAQEQLAAAAGTEVAGSMALRGLGKLYAAMTTAQNGHVRAGEPKAMVFFQAALLVHPQNYLAANDLGVLLAKCGDSHQAEDVLKHSLSISQQSTGWNNLAMVYRQLGRPELARRANRLSAAARRTEMGLRQGETAGRPTPANQASRRIQWVDPKTFAQTLGQSGPVPQTTPAADPLPVSPTASAAGKSTDVRSDPPVSMVKTMVGRWLPWVRAEEKRN